MPIIKAFIDGKKLQYKDLNHEWEDLEVNDLDLDDFVESAWRIKPYPKYRPFKNAEECWTEMKKHQPFGWVKTKDKGIRLCIVGLNQKNAFTQVGHKYDEALDEFIFADGLPFGVKEET